MKLLNVIIITQEDNFVIPDNIEKVISLQGISVSKIVSLDVQGALMNKKIYFLKGFGLLQGSKMAWKLINKKICAFIDNCFKGSLTRKKYSVKSVALKNNIPFEICNNPNKEPFLEKLRVLNPDIIVSFSSPVVFKKTLLSLPSLGCINLHCSYLPEFAGILPSFWAIYHEEKETGATVHYMDDRIDNGSILAQVRVPIEKNESMYQLILKTKLAGGELVCNIIKKFVSGAELYPFPNHVQKDCYYSWPTIEQMIEFRKKGNRFI